MNNKFITDKKLYKCFCSNCEEKGHIYRSCNMPITSIGIIAYYYDSFDRMYRYLLIRRRDSLGYVDFLRGKYNTLNNTHIQNLINEMTVYEKERLITNDFDDLWHELWNNYSEKIDVSSKHKFNTLKNSLQSSTNLTKIVQNSHTTWEEPEWGFPKGRRNHNEKDYNAALREFNEETGIPIERISIVQNIKPFEECFIGSNFKAYKHKYYLAKISIDKGQRIEDVIDMKNYQQSEVSKIGFYTLNEALSKLRNYNKERLVLLENIDKIVKTYDIQ
jgi:ADP-ribose pyrophosphatase YjhB (NUDIX family)